MLFKSKWITYVTGDYKSADDPYGNPAPYFRRAFKTEKPVKKATLYASALGVFKIYLNGKSVADDYLSPGWVDYNKKLPLIKYDITNKLAKSNAIGVILSDGWAIGHLGSTTYFKRNGYTDQVEFTAYIKIEYTDSSIEELCTDDSWLATSGAILRSDIYMGEYVDARKDVGDFSSPDYDDSDWDKAEICDFRFSRNLYLEEQKIPPIVVKHTFTPILVRKRDNTYLYDVSQNISGVLSLTVKGTRGARLVLRHGELLCDGELYTENLRKAEATDTYILSGNGTESFRPLFTFHGFRFAQIEITGDAQIVDVTAQAMYTDLEKTGEFSCSDPIATKTYQNALWGQRDNFLNVPTDCPQRDERLGWTGDAQIFCKSAMYNMDCRIFFDKYLADVRDAQLGNGLIPAVAPVPPIGSHAYTGFDAAAGWSEAIGEIPYQHYIMYGDKGIIRDNLPALKKLIGYYKAESPEYIRDKVRFYGDWLSLSTPTDLAVVSTMYYARAAYLAWKLCEIIGDYEQSLYKDHYFKIKQAFRDKFVDCNGKIFSDTQSAYVIAYSFGLIDFDEVKPNLIRKFEEDGGKLTTGFLGIKFLLPVLCDIGKSDIAYRLITDTGYPGWGYSIVNGATTIWERWNSYTKEDGILKGMNSFNHYSLGSCTQWMYEYCLGLNPTVEGAGFKKVIFKPCFDFSGKVAWAKGHYDTDFGRISLSWQKNANTVKYTVSLPTQIECSFDFGKLNVISKDVNDGTYEFLLQK